MQICIESVRRALTKCLFTLKQVRFEPEAANLPLNKEKRKTYVQSILNFMAQNRQILYMDECNFYLHITRSQGRAAIGERCSVRAAATRGPNIHVIGCIGSLGMLNCQIKRSPFKKPKAMAYLEETLRIAQTEYGCPVVLVIDNAPAHSNIEHEINPEIMENNIILRLGPYSPMLNPIENVWSMIKSNVKRCMAANNEQYVTAERNGLSIGEFRLRLLEQYVQDAINEVTPDVCIRMIASVQNLFTDAILMNDMNC